MSCDFNEQSAVAYNAARPYSRDLWCAIQATVRTVVDGSPGPKTARAARDWQLMSQINGDGKVGPSTLARMGLTDGVDVDDCEEPAGADRNRDTRRIVRDEERSIILDVSKHQGDIDWPSLARWSQVSGVIIKSTEGRDYVDPMFFENRERAQRCEVSFGNYHVASFIFEGVAMDPRAAAQDHVDAVGDGGARGSWFDLETKRIDEAVRVKGASWTADYIDVWLEEVSRLSGKLPGLYWSHRGVKALGDCAERFRSLRHWWAYYYGDDYDLPKLAGRPPKPEGWSWYRWQFTSSGLCVGIDGRVDVNVLNDAGASA